MGPQPLKLQFVAWEVLHRGRGVELKLNLSKAKNY